MRRLAAVLMGYFVLAYVLPSMSAMAQSTTEPTTQANAPAQAKRPAKAEWITATAPVDKAIAAPETDVSTQPTPPPELPEAETATPDGLRAAQASSSEPAPTVPDEREGLLARERA
ncbi:MAG: hypothetical protein ACK5RU_00605, partial [Hyphomonadaceae bacterium]